MNHFELFALPVGFALDRNELQQRYRQLQQSLHPDRFAQASERERLLAVQRSAQLNDAYSTLRDPLRRAEYLLQLQGIELAHEQQTVRDSSFLMAQMLWRERLEALAASKPTGAGGFAELDAALRDLEQETQALFEQLEAALQQADAEALKRAADLIRKLKFMAKLRLEIEAIEDQLEDE